MGSQNILVCASACSQKEWFDNKGSSTLHIKLNIRIVRPFQKFSTIASWRSSATKTVAPEETVTVVRGETFFLRKTFSWYDGVEIQKSLDPARLKSCSWTTAGTNYICNSCWE